MLWNFPVMLIDKGPILKFYTEFYKILYRMVCLQPHSMCAHIFLNNYQVWTLNVLLSSQSHSKHKSSPQNSCTPSEQILCTCEVTVDEILVTYYSRDQVVNSDRYCIYIYIYSLVDTQIVQCSLQIINISSLNHMMHKTHCTS